MNNANSRGANKVSIIGVGPGTIEYLLPVAKKEIERANCLIGARRILSLFRYPDKKKIRLQGHFKKALFYIKKNKDREKIAVLVSGDPGLFSFLGLIKQDLKKEEYRVIPGISTLQLAFARIGESWQDIKIISIHGRNFHNLAKAIGAYDKVFLLTDLKFSPQNVARYLIKRRIRNRKVVVFENLTYPNERIVETDLKNLSKMGSVRNTKAHRRENKISNGVGGFGLCVMLIKK